MFDCDEARSCKVGFRQVRDLVSENARFAGRHYRGATNRLSQNATNSDIAPRSLAADYQSLGTTIMRKMCPLASATRDPSGEIAAVGMSPIDSKLKDSSRSTRLDRMSDT